MSTERRARILPLFGALLVFSIAALTAGCGSSSGGASTATRPAGVTLLEPAAYRDALAADPAAFVVNVHTPYEGEIAGTSAFVAFDTVTGRAADLPADKAAPLYIYCRSGRMSAEATPALQALGYTNIIDLHGGMNAWREAGLPIVEKPPA